MDDNLFDRARAHIPAKERIVEVLFQCWMCTNLRVRDAYGTRPSGERDTICKACVAYERTQGGEDEREESTSQET